MKLPHSQVIVIPLTYALFGAIWILGSDTLLHWFIRDAELMTQFQTYKGWTFIAVTAILVYTLLRGYDNAMLRAFQRESDARLEALANGKLYRTIVETAEEGVWMVDAQNHTTFVNQKLADILGYTLDEFQGQPLSDFTDQEGGQILTANLERCRQGFCDQYDVRLLCKNGAPKWTMLSTSPLFNEQAEFSGTLFMVTDIAQRKAIELENTRLVSILETTSDLVGITDDTGVPVYLNKAGRSLLGIPAQADLSTVSLDRMYTDDSSRRMRDIALPAAQKQGIWRGETEIRNMDNLVIPFSQVIIYHAAGGDKPYLSTIARDIREAKRAESEIQRHLQRLEALRAGEIAISSSLDLRLALDVILDQTISQLEVDAASILLLNAASQTLDYAAGRGFRSSAIRETRLNWGAGNAGRAAQERTIIHIPDLTSDPGSLTRLLEMNAEGFISYVAVPLIAKSKIKGVLEIFQRQPLQPDENWLGFLETLARQAAIVLESAGMVDQLQRTNQQLTLAYEATIVGWSRALDLRDKETEGHTQRVTDLSQQLALKLGVSESDRINMRRGALLHDIGKMGVPDSILHKPGPLTEEEMGIMRQHPVLAYEMLLPINYLRPALEIPYCHHEKWDGTGYPRGLVGEEIPLAARIFSVVDVWDALTSNRPYRPAWPQSRAWEYIQQHAGVSFDSMIVKAFGEMTGTPF